MAVVKGEPKPEVVWTRGAAMHETHSKGDIFCPSAQAWTSYTCIRGPWLRLSEMNF